ncbi:MAG: hypothetical protein NT158_07460 [Cyanobacteria bacterium]|nr:hypothetical protein [Cyanobacteriota bacterium]
MALSPSTPPPSGDTSPQASGDPSSNAALLYSRISGEAALTQALFRQALQDPSGTLSRIVEIGAALGLPVSVDEVRAHIASLDDLDTKQWLLKARGGL